jgi:hypothetical protein
VYPASPLIYRLHSACAGMVWIFPLLHPYFPIKPADLLSMEQLDQRILAPFLP